MNAAAAKVGETCEPPGLTPRGARHAFPRAVRRLAILSVLLLAVGSCVTAEDGTSGSSQDPTTPGRAENGTATSGDGTRPSQQQDATRGLSHVLVTGQSNSVGFAGTPALTTTQPFQNLMFDVGVMTARSCDDDGCLDYAKPTKLVPLVEGDTYFDYPVETIASGLANEAAKLTPQSQLLVSVHGRSGNSYACLRKGGCAFYEDKSYLRPFEEAMKQVEDAKALAASQKLDYVVRAVAVIHGESDHYAPPFPLDGTSGAAGGVQTYADALVEWQQDYETSIQALTRQTAPVPLLVSQMSNWNDRPESEIPTRQLEAHGRAQGKVVLVGPTYMLPFAEDCIHFTNHGERRLGEYFAKAYSRVVAGSWEPLRPIAATRSGTNVVVRFAVPAPPLVLDTERVTDPGGFGFEWVGGDGNTLTIKDVKVTAPDAVTIELASAPSGPGRVRYAMRATPYTCPGPTSGPRGNLRDSDATPSMYGYDLTNWAVHFDLPVE